MKQLIGVTGPSAFSDECQQLVEKHLNQNFILLCHDDDNNLNYWLNKCDGFLITGGLDVHPSTYGRDIINQHNLSKFDLQRDLREFLVIEYALETKKPMLGICRGHQLIGLYHGVKGDFCLDLSNAHTVHHPNKSSISANKGEPIHSIELLDPKQFPIEDPPERAILKNIFVEEQKKTLWVNSFHHQGIYYNPNGFPYMERGIKVLGLASADTNKEQFKIIELMQGDNWISCQWHPEWDYEVNTPSRAVIDHFKRILCKKS